MSRIISFDESGNTGSDLLNVDQNVFVLASVCFEQDDLMELKTLFNGYGELHFVKLKNSKKGREKIIEFINHRFITEDKIVCSVSDKEYLVIAQIIDQLVETVLYNSNVDIYQFGLNLTYTNSLYYFGNNLWNKELYYKVLHSFVKMMRLRDEHSVNDFYHNVNDLYKRRDTQEKEILLPVLYSKKYINEIFESVNKYTLDVTLSSFLVICDLWFKKTGEKMIVHFDKSKQIEYYKEFIDKIRTMNTDKVDVGYGSRTMTFPTQIECLELVDSDTDISIQFADLIASTIAFMYNNKNAKQEPFVEEIKKSKLIDLSNFHTIWPSTQISAEDLNMTDGKGINILDFLADKL